MLIIFCPLKIISDFHFRKMALQNKLRTKSFSVLCYCHDLFTLRSRFTEISPRQGPQRKNGVSYHSARSPYRYHLASHKSYKTAVNIRASECAHLPYLRTLYPSWFQNYRTQIRQGHCAAICSLTASYSRNDRPPYSVRSFCSMV
jgi:hypothetical protein